MNECTLELNLPSTFIVRPDLMSQLINGIYNLAIFKHKIDHPFPVHFFSIYKSEFRYSPQFYPLDSF